LWQDAAVSASKKSSRPSTTLVPAWAKFVATAGYAGFSPVAPGTCGTLVAVPIAWLLTRSGSIAFAVGLVVITVVGTWASEVFCRATGVDDDQRIVIDEVAGYLLTIAFVPRGWVNIILGVIVFRLFDIWKPGPIRLVDQKVHGGVGVMADDLAAGVVGALVMVALHYLGVDAWLGAHVHG
jgi:phosphatidylglycerophosphatase A